MLSRFVHPRRRTLSDFADGLLDPRRAGAVASHVARCEACRSFVWVTRALDAAALELPAPALSSDVRARVLARRAAGEEVILPAAQGAHAPRRRRHGTATAAAAVVVVAAAVGLVLGTPRAMADTSELRISPASPRIGDTIRVEYRATARLGSEAELVLRARLRRPHTAMGAEHHKVAVLRRSGDTYTAAFVLPDSVVYAVVAVEDSRAGDVDHSGERWEIVMYGEDGAPLFAAVNQQFRDLSERDLLRARDVAVRMTTDHPRRVRSWFNAFVAESALLGREQTDSLQQDHRAALQSRLGARLPDSEDELADLVFYAGAIRDTATARSARAQLLERFPASPAAQQQRVFATDARTRADYFAELERIWSSAPAGQRHPQVASSGMQAAQQWQEPEALRVWGLRSANTPDDTAWIAGSFLAMPQLRAEGIELLARLLPRLEHFDDRYRRITQTADEYRALRNRGLGSTLARLGKALSDEGRDAEGAAFLTRAVDLTWDVALFRRVADYRLAAGDTTAALPLLARVAVDPATPAAFSDSIRSWVPADSWEPLRTSALGTMQHHVMQLVTNRAVRGRPRLTAADGSAVTFEPASAGPTFVARWSRFCPPSAMQMSQLGRLAAELQQRGVRVITITDEAPSQSLSEYLARNELQLPVLHDTNFEARRALDSFGTPNYMVLDRHGRIRFDGYSMDDVLRQVTLLQGTAPHAQQ